MNREEDKTDDIVVIDLPDNKDEALKILASYNDTPCVKITGYLPDWMDFETWIRKNNILYLDLYDIDMKELGDYEYVPSDDMRYDGELAATSLTELVLPHNLEFIGAGCFEDSDLKIIHFPSTLKHIEFEVFAFSGTSIEEIIIELSRETKWLFCCFLHSNIRYTIKDECFKEIDGVLYDTRDEQLLKFPAEYKGDYNFPKNIKSVADYAFRKSKLSYLSIPDHIKELGYGVFRDAEIDTITIGEGIKKLKDFSFKKTRVKNIILPESLEEIGIHLFKDTIGLVSVQFRNINPVFEIEDSIIYNKPVNSVAAAIPNSSDIYEVRAGTRIVGAEAFSVYDLTSEKKIRVNLPQSIEEIGENAFSYSISEIELPDKLKRIGKYAFNYCSLKKVIIPESVEYIEEGAFCGCTSLNEINLPHSLQKLEGSTFMYCTSLEHVEIPENVSEIGDKCFWECSKIEAINLPTGLKTIWGMAFYGCNSLKYISLPASLESINDGVFYGCTSLEEIILPDNLYYLGSLAFGDCRSLQSINIPSGCELFDADMLFQFNGCTSLVNVMVSEDNPNYLISGGILYNKLGDFLIRSFSGNKVVKILDRTRIIGPYSFAGTSCEKIFLTDNVVKIELRAFENCRNLKHVVMSRNLEEIVVEYNVGPFNECSNLAKITNISLETLQKYAEVFKEIHGAIVSVEKEQIDENSDVGSNDNESGIPGDVLEALNSKYFRDPMKTMDRIREILKHSDNNLVKRDSQYLNTVRKLLEDTRSSLQTIGIIPFRCTALGTGLNILHRNWPDEIVPEYIRQRIVQVKDICSKGSHDEFEYYSKFRDYGFTNSDIVEFCMAMVRYVKYIADYCESRGLKGDSFAMRFDHFIYGSEHGTETLDSTTGFLHSYTRTNSYTKQKEQVIEVIHYDKSWSKVKIYKDVIMEYKRRTGCMVELNQKIRVKVMEKLNQQNFRYWIATEILEVIREPLFQI